MLKTGILNRVGLYNPKLMDILYKDFTSFTLNVKEAEHVIGGQGGCSTQTSICHNGGCTEKYSDDGDGSNQTHTGGDNDPSGCDE